MNQAPRAIRSEISVTLLTLSLIGLTLSSSACTASTPDSPSTTDTSASIPAFIGDKNLTFRYPADWNLLQEDGLVTVASFPPPHRGLAGSLPSKLVITILPYQTALYDKSSSNTSTLDNGTWIVGGAPEFPKEVAYFVHQQMSVSVIGAYPDEVELAEVDLATIKSLCESMTLETGTTP